ncbi:Fbxo10 [Columba guinea]|nr:Fbxo10 [Columba guinea]
MRWRQLCLGVLQHRPPNWPNRPDAEPPSWTDTCKQHYLASKTWTRNMQDPRFVTCLSLFCRRKGRRRLRVGAGGDFGSLCAALAAAGPYDRLVLLPSVQEEQSEVLLKTTSGYVQFDSCRFEGGQLQIRAPGTCQVKFCTFSRSSVHLHSVALCVLENCGFVGSENASVLMLRNDVQHCKASGIFLRLSAGGLIADNNIHSNGTASVDIRKGANPPVLCNKIHSGLCSGIVIVCNGKGIIRSNQICGNKEAGIYILYNGNPAVSLPHLINNQISHNSIYRVAMFCCKDDAGDYPLGQGGSESFQEEREGAGGENDPDSEEKHPAAQRPISVVLVELNSISHNGAAGLHVKSREVLNVFANVIRANGNGVVSVLQGSQLACITNNSISCNSRAGVLVEAECQVELHGSGIYENGSHGIISNGGGVITENDIIDDHRCGLQLLQAAHMKHSVPRGEELSCAVGKASGCIPKRRVNGESFSHSD